MHTMSHPHPTPAHSPTTPTPRRNTTVTLVGADPHPPKPTPIWRAALARWRQAVAGAILLGVLAMTLRAAVHELGARGVWLTIGSVVVIAIPAAIDAGDHTHSQPRPSTRKWT
jgi:hypothetical protein